MSLVSDLASVLRCPGQHAAHAPPEIAQALTDSQSMPLHQHSATQGVANPAGNEATTKAADEPLTPALGSAPKPYSWPKAHQEKSPGPDWEQLQFSSLQPSEPTQPPTADLAQSALDLNSQSPASTSSSQAETVASQMLVSNEGKSDVAAVLRKHCEVSLAGEPDSLWFAPPEGPSTSGTDKPEAPSATPERCSLCATLHNRNLLHYNTPLVSA